MRVSEEFDEWAAEGEDREMEDRHWQTAKHVLARMPVESGDSILDLGTGSGYALRALRETVDAGRCYGLDASPEMLRNARSYTDDPGIGYLRGDFDALPLSTDSIDHVFSMEAFFFARDPRQTLAEIERVLVPGGTFFCAVDFFEESEHTHHWQAEVEPEMTLWDRRTYREAFREAGLAVATQESIPNREVEIPPAEAFPVEEQETGQDWETQEAMVDRYLTHGTLLTVGVA